MKDVSNNKELCEITNQPQRIQVKVTYYPRKGEMPYYVFLVLPQDPMYKHFPLARNIVIFECTGLEHCL